LSAPFARVAERKFKKSSDELTEREAADVIAFVEAEARAGKGPEAIS
jgi:hypothetical protein